MENRSRVTLTGVSLKVKLNLVEIRILCIENKRSKLGVENA